MNFEHNHGLKLAHDFITFTGKNVFLTGKAGTGKTTFLHHLKKNALKRMIVVAPTGVAAINAGGVTIHSFFQLPFGPIIPNIVQADNPLTYGRKDNNSSQKKFNREKISIIKSLDLLVIDEISMVRADLLDAVDEALRRYRNRNLPFGGVQLLMIGDLQQLSPIVKEEEWSLLKDYYDTWFFFGSRALQKTDYVSIELKHVYRQSDEKFIALLNKVRDKKLDHADLVELNKRYIPDFQPKEEEGYIILTTHNKQAQEINELKLGQLKGALKRFEAEVTGDYPEYNYPTDYELSLKNGAQVMFVKNDMNREKRYFNGKIGRIVRFGEGLIYVICPGDLQEIAVEPVEWQNHKYTIHEETKEIEEQIIGTFTQFPLKLAWAITIHKSQGLTFEKAIIKANFAFAFGQVYVALSRCRSLEGMVLAAPVGIHNIKENYTVAGFVEKVEKEEPGEQQLESSKEDYQKAKLEELFTFNTFVGAFRKIIREIDQNSDTLHHPKLEEVVKMELAFKTDILDVSEKFRNQVKGLLQQETLVESNELLQDRIKKASRYFQEKIRDEITDPLPKMKIETDNKSVKKVLQEFIQALFEEAMVKKACLEAAFEGFTVLKYLETRSKAQIEKPVFRFVSDHVAETSGMGRHGKLILLLKLFRDQKATEQQVQPYEILPQKTLEELSVFLPLTKKELKSIHGLGKKKIGYYGDDILRIVRDYCEEHSLHTDAGEEPEREAAPVKPMASKEIILNLFREGNTLDEIVTIRQMARSTIEGHLAEFIETGELDVNLLVQPEKLEKIKEYFSHHPYNVLAPAKAALGDEVTFGDLRFVQKYMMFLEKQVK